LIVERTNAKPSIFIFGAGHVGQALALTSILLGYEVVVVDDRAEFASRNRLPDPGIKLVVDDFDRAIKNLNIGARSAAVIVTRGHQFDEICLENLLRLQVGYLGMIGSRRRVISIFKKLSQQGFADTDLSRVHAPIGLSIGARSPQEIAIAILAEIIAETNKTSLSS
jgi:xanthine dehydrogenase accessory factor